MDVMEKLTELLDDMQRSGTSYFGSSVENKKIATHLISNGVTVVRHGQWLYDSRNGKYFCSACDDYALSLKKDTLYGDDLYDVCLTDYCPSCGARMDEKA